MSVSRTVTQCDQLLASQRRLSVRLSVCLSVCLSVTQCTVAFRVAAGVESCTIVFLEIQVRYSEGPLLLYFRIIISHSVLSGTYSVGSMTKSIRPRLRLRPKLQDQNQDRGRSETSLVIQPRSQSRRLFNAPKLGVSWPWPRWHVM